MARFRKTLYLIVEGCVLVTLSVTAGVLVLHENVFRQLPLYCFLEEKAQERSVGQDRETYEKLMESNARYLGRMVVDENKEVGSQENDKEIVDKQTKRENEQNLKAERQEENVITPTEKTEITVTPITQNTEEQKVKNADKQTEPEENLTEESTGEEEVTTAAAQVQPMPEIDLAPERLADYDYLMNHFFILDPNTETSAQQLNAAALLGEDLTLRKEKAEPQILIYHSHSQETFADSREGKTEYTIVGGGDYLERAIRKALEILSREAGERDRGFILMVEGSQIDLRAHDNDAEGVLAEMRDFDRAVAAAMDFADRHPGTLVVVTADHETGGLSIPSADVDFEHEEAGIEYRFSTGGHTAAMVPVYLYGTGAERINGVLDNTELALRLAGTLGLR